MADDTTLVLFGASGDLSARLLLPALGQLLMTEPTRTVRLVGAGMDEWSDADLERVVERAYESSHSADALARTTIEYQRCDMTSADDLRSLLARADDASALYFAVPPAVTAAACEALDAGMLPASVMLALEKPFGSDEASARALNERLAELVPESQVFRIDHFLGRSSILNFLGVRFANRLMEPVWSAEHIAEVSIIYDERLGLEGRAGYYDRAGALVDMVQSHLLQLLAVVAMDRPDALDEKPLRDAKSAVLEAVRVWGDDPAAASRRARYTAGEIDGSPRVGYLDEPGVDPARDTETLAEVTFEVRTPRWAGVPFTVRSGKALGARFAQVAVRFRAADAVPRGFTGSADGEVMRFVLGPDVMTLDLNVNGPGDPFELDRATMSAELAPGALQAYAEVLGGILDRDPMLAVRGDAAEVCWRIVAPVLESWRRGEVPMEEYAAGSLGPAWWTNRR